MCILSGLLQGYEKKDDQKMRFLLTEACYRLISLGSVHVQQSITTQELDLCSGEAGLEID